MAVYLCLFVVLTLLAVAQAGPKMCQEGYNSNGTTITFDTTCPTDCSQEIDRWIFVNKNCSQYPPRIDGDTQFFNCSIGGQQEVTSYRKTNSKKFEVSSQKFSAPRIKEMELYYKCFDNGCYRTEMALKFKFLLPRGIPGKEVSDSVMPQAVLLRFESVEDTSVRDEYYYVCPRERIFQFHNYLLVNAYDLYSLRELSYDCLVGLQTKHRVVYNITLQTVQGQSASYITTIIPRQPNFTTHIIPWQPVIMTHSNVTDYSLLVVVEEAPPMYKVMAYTVELIREPAMSVKSSKTIDFKNKHYANFTIFRNISTGQYHIKVIPHCPKACVVNTTSYHIDYIGNFSDYPDYLEETMDAMQVVAMVAGCVGGVFVLVIFSILYFLRVRKNQERYSGIKPKGYIIHPHKPDSREYEIVRHLKSFITEYCDCTVLDYLDMNLNTDLTESREERIKNSLRESSFVVVTYSHTRHDDRTGNSICSDFYSFVLNKTIEQRKRSNNLRIIEIRFPTNSISNVCPIILSEHRKSIKTVNFETEPVQVYCKIHGTKSAPENNANEALKSKTQWRLIMAHFQPSFGFTGCTSRTEDPEAEPLITAAKPNNVTDNPDEHRPSDQSGLNVPKDTSAIFKRMASLNQDTDEEEDGGQFNLVESQGQSIQSTHCESTTHTRSIAQRHSDIHNKNIGCPISIEADVHTDHLPSNRPVNKQQVTFKTKATNDIPISEPPLRISKGPTTTAKVTQLDGVSVSIVKRANTDPRVGNGQPFPSLPDACYHNNSNNERSDRRQPKREPARQILYDFNASDTDHDEFEDPIEHYQGLGHNNFAHLPDSQRAQHIPHHQRHHQRHHHRQHPPHPHHQQYHPSMYADQIVYGGHATRGNHFDLSHDNGGNTIYNEGFAYPYERQHMNELCLNNFQPGDNVHYQRHSNGVDPRLRVPRVHVHRYGGPMEQVDFHPQHNPHLPITSPSIPSEFLLNNAEGANINFNAVDPPADRTHETSVKERYGVPSVHRYGDPMEQVDFHPQHDPHLPITSPSIPSEFLLNNAEGANINFNAVDPPADRTHETSVKERYGAPPVRRSASSKSLPPGMWNAPCDLADDPTGINEYNRYNPIPPDEDDEGEGDDQKSLRGSSDIVEQLLEINQIGKTK